MTHLKRAKRPERAVELVSGWRDGIPRTEPGEVRATSTSSEARARPELGPGATKSTQHDAHHRYDVRSRARVTAQFGPWREATFRTRSGRGPARQIRRAE